MKRLALILVLILALSALLPAADARVDPHDSLAVDLLYFIDTEYAIGDQVTVTIYVHNQGQRYDPDEVTFSIGSSPSRPGTVARSGEGSYFCRFTLEESDINYGSTGVTVWGWAKDPGVAVADSGMIRVKHIDIDIIVPESGDQHPAPGELVEVEIRTSYDGAPVDVDAGTMRVYLVRPGATNVQIPSRRVDVGIYTTNFTHSVFKKWSEIYQIEVVASYTAPEGLIHGFTREVFEVQLFPVWMKIVKVTVAQAVVDVYVMEAEGLPYTHSIEGYPLAGALVNLTYKYHDGSAWKELSVEGFTDTKGVVRFTLRYSDIIPQSTGISVVGRVEVNNYQQKLDSFIQIRDKVDPSDETGFEVDLLTDPIPFVSPVTLKHRARFDGAPLPNQKIYVYVNKDDVMLFSGEVTTDSRGNFDVTMKAPTGPQEGSPVYVVDECYYNTQVQGQWYIDTRWLYFGDPTLFGEFNLTLDRDTKLEVGTIKDHATVDVTVYHADADGEDEKAIVIWGLGDPKDRDWRTGLYIDKDAPIRHRWNVWPANAPNVEYAPCTYEDGMWRTSFHYPGHLPEAQEVFVYGAITFINGSEQDVKGALKTGLVAQLGKGWPSSDITGPPYGSEQEGSVNVTGTASEDTESVEVRVDGGEWQAVDGTTEWSYELDTTELPEGSHTIEVRSFNGDHYSKLQELRITTDNKPTVTVISPMDQGHYHGKLIISGTAWDDGLLESVELSIDGGAYLLVDGLEEWGYELDLSSMTSGDHTLAARAFDGLKHSFDARLVFVVDLLPEVTITDPPPDGEVEGTFHIKGTASDDLDLQQVEVKVDNQDWDTVTGTTDWSYELDTTAMTYGEHTVEARAFDGYEYSETESVTFYVDNPPAISEINIEDGQTLGGVVEINGTASDDKGVEKVEVQIDGGDWVEVDGGESWRYTLDTTELADGAHKLKVRGYDGESYSDLLELDFNVDQPPEVADINIEDGGTYGGTVEINGTASDEGTVEEVQVRIDGGDWVTVDGGETWKYMLDTTGLSHGEQSTPWRSGASTARPGPTPTR
jgi:hypothetical protein